MLMSKLHKFHPLNDGKQVISSAPTGDAPETTPKKGNGISIGKKGNTSSKVLEKWIINLSFQEKNIYVLALRQKI